MNRLNLNTWRYSAFAAFTVVAMILFASCNFSKIPEPKSVFGFDVGEDYQLFDYEQSVEYFKKLEGKTDRMQLKQVGFTSFERPWYVAVISTPENLKNLEYWRGVNQQIAHPEHLSEDEAEKLMKDARIFVDINGGLHATEIASSQHIPEFAYELMSMDKKEFENYFDKTILILWPSLNPDGQSIVVDWYRKIKDTEFPDAPLIELYQKYVGHDNNRDGYMLNMQESRVQTYTWRYWEPEIAHTHHQFGGGFFGGGDYHRIWLPPFAEPVGVHTPPRMLREMNMLGTQMAMELDTRGLRGATHMGTGFDAYYPGYNDYLGMYQNIVAYWTETLSNSYAGPRYTDPAEVLESLKSLRPRALYASPWEGGWWRLRDQVDYMIGVNYGVLKFASRNREDILYNRYKSGMEAIEHYTHNAPYAYVVPQDQHDRMAAVELLQRLAFNGLKIDRLTKAATIEGITYPTGTWVIRTAQEFGRLAQELLEIQEYPEIEEYPGGPLEQPYDVAGWTLPFTMNVNTHEVKTSLSDDVMNSLEPVLGEQEIWDGVKNVSLRTQPVAAGIELPGAMIAGNGSALALNPAENNSYRLINRALANGGKVVYTSVNSENRKGGRYVVSGIDKSELGGWAGELSLQAEWTEAAAGQEIRSRIGIYSPWNPSMDEGWTRWLLEQHEFEFSRIRNDEIKAGNLNQKYDVILFASMSGAQILNGIPANRTPAEYAGGIGVDGANALRTFVNSGGTMVCMNQSCAFAIEQFKLPVQNVVGGVSRNNFFIAGSVLQAETNPNSRIMSGAPVLANIYFNNSPVFKTLAGFRGTVLAGYARSGDILKSGYSNGENYLHGNAAALDVNLGRGHVIMFGFSPQWRGQTFGTFKMLFNSLYTQ